jgi:hypothetical protein
LSIKWGKKNRVSVLADRHICYSEKQETSKIKASCREIIFKNNKKERMTINDKGKWLIEPWG